MKPRLEPALGRPGTALDEAASPNPEVGQGLLAIARAAIAAGRRTGDGRRRQTEAAFRALLQAEPCLSVERAKAIIEAALDGGRSATTQLAARGVARAASRAWILPLFLLALVSLAVAGPLAWALLPFALDPAAGAPISLLTARLALALPASLLLFPLLAWMTAGRQRPVLTRTLCLLPLLHITVMAGSLALP